MITAICEFHSDDYQLLFCNGNMSMMIVVIKMILGLSWSISCNDDHILHCQSLWTLSWQVSLHITPINVGFMVVHRGANRGVSQQKWLRGQTLVVVLWCWLRYVDIICLWWLMEITISLILDISAICPMYVCRYVCMYVCVCVCMYVCLSVCLSVCMYVW